MNDKYIVYEDGSYAYILVQKGEGGSYVHYQTIKDLTRALHITKLLNEDHQKRRSNEFL